MKIYLVGGAVRDKLLNLPVKERDWVVVGATPEQMLKMGYRSVGKDFPVFLEPKTNEEYALARIERKIGRGYTGFDFNASPEVSLEDDLKRRDLTINAMAEDSVGTLFDPYGGQQDLTKRILRHVSPAFAEDPVRILRIARFAARYAYLDFTVADETLELMKQMVLAGEVDALVPERVWKEFERALGEKNPEQFFRVLLTCGALEKLFPAFLLSERSQEKFRGENALKKVMQKTADKSIRFSALLSDLSAAEIIKISAQYRIPTELREQALKLKQLQQTWQAINVGLSAKAKNDSHSLADKISQEILELLVNVDAFRRKERFMKILKTASLLEIKNINLLEKCYNSAGEVTASAVMQNRITGKEIGEEIYKKRKQKIKSLLSEHFSSS